MKLHHHFVTSLCLMLCACASIQSDKEISAYRESNTNYDGKKIVSLQSQKRYATILFRARTIEAKRLSKQTVSILLDIMHVGPYTGTLVSGSHIRAHFMNKSYLQLYGRRWAKHPEDSIGFAHNYLIDQWQAGSLSNLRFSPSDSQEDLVLRGESFWDFSRKIFSINQ